MMNRRSHFATAISSIAIAAVLGGCAIGQQKRESIFGSKVDRSNIGLATRAQAALSAQQYATAVELAERAVENTPNDAGFRALLGNCYFASGRFASAEQAYRDSLALFPSQPKLILKLALVQIAQGKNADALGLLDAASGALDPADYGLAIALAGRPADAVAVLDQTARMSGADARVRQNLALAYGLSGDWTMARTVAEQDVPPEQLDTRIHQWMAMATPSQPSDQVAALTGVHPAADPGQPQRLALRNGPNNQALAQAAVPQAQPQPQPVAEIPASPPPALADPAPAVAEADVPPAPVVAEAARSIVAASTSEPLAPLPTKFDAPVQPASYVAISDTVRHAASERRGGKSSSVLQLGAFSSAEGVAAAWQKYSKRFPSLNKYHPVSARFQSARGTVYRLSVKGFESAGEAQGLCSTLRGKGANCFVRRVAGDAPVQFASR